MTVTRFGNRPLLGKKTGFGILFPPDSGIRARGVLLNSSIFPGRVSKGHYSETFIFGGALDVDVVKLKEDEIVSILEEDRKRLRPKTTNPSITTLRSGNLHFRCTTLHFLNSTKSWIVVCRKGFLWKEIFGTGSV